MTTPAMETGKRGNFCWIEDKGSSIADLKSRVPDIVLGKYLIVTAIDNQPPLFLHRDWFLHDDVAINPSVKSIADVPTGDRDEWYVFTRAPLLEPFEVFVTTPHFCLSTSYNSAASADVEQQQNEEPNQLTELQRRFWNQLELKAVETYASSSDRLIVATRNTEIYEKLIRAKGERRSGSRCSWYRL